MSDEELEKIRKWRRELPSHVASRYAAAAVDQLLAEVDRLRGIVVGAEMRTNLDVMAKKAKEEAP